MKRQVETAETTSRTDEQQVEPPKQQVDNPEKCDVCARLDTRRCQGGSETGRTLDILNHKRGLIEGAIMARTHGTTSLAERTQPQGRSTESLYYLSLIVGEKAGQRTQTRVIPTKSAFLYFHPEAAHRRATYPRVPPNVCWPAHKRWHAGGNCAMKPSNASGDHLRALSWTVSSPVYQ